MSSKEEEIDNFIKIEEWESFEDEETVKETESEGRTTLKSEHNEEEEDVSKANNSIDLGQGALNSLVFMETVLKSYIIFQLKTNFILDNYEQC